MRAARSAWVRPRRPESNGLTTTLCRTCGSCREARTWRLALKLLGLFVAMCPSVTRGRVHLINQRPRYRSYRLRGVRRRQNLPVLCFPCVLFVSESLLFEGQSFCSRARPTAGSQALITSVPGERQLAPSLDPREMTSVLFVPSVRFN